MRTKNHNLKLKGRIWYLRYDVPQDVRTHFSEITGRTREESLRTTEVKLARRLRDERLRKLEIVFSSLRLSDQRKLACDDDPLTLALTARDDGRGELLEELLLEEVDAEASRRARGPHSDDLNEAREELSSIPRFATMARQLAVLRGIETPLRPLCEEWLRTQHSVTAKTLSDYRTALRLLCDKFDTVEAAENQGASKRFLAALLLEKAKPTVNKYIISYRGVWSFNERDERIWSAKRLDSAIPKIDRVPWTDDEYYKLLAAAKKRRDSRLTFAIRIAAHTGASASGISRLEVRETDEKLSLWLPETKTGHRSRLIPCHPEIALDARAWAQSPMTASYLSKRFGHLKSELGYGKGKDLHAFRHSVTNKLENAGVDSRPIKRLLGHKLSGDITFGTYNAKGLDHEALDKIVRQIKWTREA